ncbi:uncharacterized protein LOC131614044 [Vicia villosa]|uniref:uncharacterized protein LOC131614044 n=1 Tax=Vicia villosa TaxID=3911 RepID=UPI00273C531F|nr:uncharacterized protein LOC131614044 [Vicia villosa]
MDLSMPLNHNVLVEREGFTFFSDIEYESLPTFCGHCRKTGHVVQECKMLGLHQASGIPKNQKVGFGFQCINSQNFAVQAPEESESSMSAFVDATQDIPDRHIEGFLQSSWDNIAKLPKPDGVFSSAVAGLKK